MMVLRSGLLVVLCGFLSLTACRMTRTVLRYGPGEVPLFTELGSHHRPVSTSSAEAQVFFDQGLTWTYSFNHDEAIRSFEAATKLDPNCAMAWWGIALCNGPHINNPVMPPERSEAAWAALVRAQELRDYATPVEQSLIDALAMRYADPAPQNRSSLDEAYAAAMGRLWLANGRDDDIGTLYAESLMDLRPWDLWTKDGQPQPGTEEILAVLEAVMEVNPNNPGANHLYVHAIEASPDPSRADVSADRLRKLVPDSGHMVHMPSHIDVLVGRWKQASIQNERAIKADHRYLVASPDQGFYRLYMFHNHHMLAFASMMEGRQRAGLRAARAVVESVPEDYKRENAALVDPYMGAAYDVLKRFGMWDEMLAEPAPPEYLPITTAMWRFNRGLAYAAKGDIAAAEQERAAFLQAVAAVPDDANMAINPASCILAIATHMLNGEIAFRKGDMDESVAELRQAVAIEDDLMYMEPPEWVQPVRHTLGVVLLSAGRYEEAEQTYREDLVNWPANGWSLYGLSRSLEYLGAAQEARKARVKFRQAWRRADTRISSSCLCVPST